MERIISLLVMASIMERTISVKGEGRVRVRPDMVRLNGVVQDVCDTYDEAVDRSVTCISPLRMRLTESGFDSEILRSVSVSVRPHYEYEGDDHRQVLRGFEYIHSMRIEVGSDSDMVNRILGALSGDGCPRFSMEYALADKTSAEEDARRSAVADAISKAEQITTVARVGLGSIISIRYGQDDMRPLMMCDRSVNGSADIVPESLEFTDEVLIEWEII